MINASLLLSLYVDDWIIIEGCLASIVGTNAQLEKYSEVTDLEFMHYFWVCKFGKKVELSFHNPIMP